MPIIRLMVFEGENLVDLEPLVERAKRDGCMPYGRIYMTDLKQYTFPKIMVQGVCQVPDSTTAKEIKASTLFIGPNYVTVRIPNDRDSRRFSRLDA